MEMKNMNGMKMLLGALMALMVLGGMAMAQADTTFVQATIGPDISLAVPADFNWPLTQGLNTQSLDNLAVSTNAPWEVDAGTYFVSPDDYGGCFYSGNAHAAGLGDKHTDGTINNWPGFLHNALILNALTLTNVQQTLASGSGTGDITVPVTMKQTVVIADPAETDYRIRIEFSAMNP
jgi:hypothetical protein